jgi:hypothetical protein
MSTDTTTRFNFRNCFYRESRDTDQEICNVTVACAIILVLLCNFQNADARQLLMNRVIGIASGNGTPQEKTAAVRTALGDSMKCDPGGEEANETKLVAGGDSVSGGRVDRVYQWHHYMKDRVTRKEEHDLISFLLAYFNLPNTIRAMNKPDAMKCIVSNRLLYTVLNIMSDKFQEGDDKKFYNKGRCWMLQFLGTDIYSAGCSGVESFSIILPKGLTHEAKQTVVGCLSDIQTAVEQINTSDMQTAVEQINTSAIQTEQTDAQPQEGESTNDGRTNCNDDFDDNHNDHCDKCEDFCDDVKENFKKHLHIVLFIIAAAALLAGSAIALTTYFHVGTTLMLAGGFIPFLNFVGGFQISLLLGVVSIATFSVGGIYAIAKTSTCCDECCNEEQHLETTSSSSSSSYASSSSDPGKGAFSYHVEPDSSDGNDPFNTYQDQGENTDDPVFQNYYTENSDSEHYYDPSCSE